MKRQANSVQLARRVQAPVNPSDFFNFIFDTDTQYVNFRVKINKCSFGPFCVWILFLNASIHSVSDFCLYACLPVCLPVAVPSYLYSVCLYAYLSVCLPVCWSVCLYGCVSKCCFVVLKGAYPENWHVVFCHNK